MRDHGSISHYLHVQFSFHVMQRPLCSRTLPYPILMSEKVIYWTTTGHKILPHTQIIPYRWLICSELKACGKELHQCHQSVMFCERNFEKL